MDQDTPQQPHRYEQLATALKISVNKLETEIDTPNTLKTAVRRGSDVSGEIMQKILKRYPQVSADWLITGEGNVFKESATNNTTEDSSVKYIKFPVLSETEVHAIQKKPGYPQLKEMVINKIAEGSIVDVLVELYMRTDNRANA